MTKDPVDNKKKRSEVSEYKGRGSKGQNKIGLSKEIDRLMKMYKPSLTEFIDELKRVFPFTYKSHIKE
tara:strand:- start:17 stop:220 length:204 start_codon:yes stop_codon:yes gene_type:complete